MVIPPKEPEAADSSDNMDKGDKARPCRRALMILRSHNIGDLSKEHWPNV